VSVKWERGFAFPKGTEVCEKEKKAQETRKKESVGREGKGTCSGEVLVWRRRETKREVWESLEAPYKYGIHP